MGLWILNGAFYTVARWHLLCTKKALHKRKGRAAILSTLLSYYYAARRSGSISLEYSSHYRAGKLRWGSKMDLRVEVKRKRNRNAWAALVSAQRPANWARPICLRPFRLISIWEVSYRSYFRSVFPKEESPCPWFLIVKHFVIVNAGVCQRLSEKLDGNCIKEGGRRASHLISQWHQRVELSRVPLMVDCCPKCYWVVSTVLHFSSSWCLVNYLINSR